MDLATKQKFEQDGYIVFDPKIDEKWLDEARSVTSSAFTSTSTRMYNLVHVYNCINVTNHGVARGGCAADDWGTCRCRGILQLRVAARSWRPCRYLKS